MAQYKTPGVYIVEENAFPNSIVEVETAVPAFIGCTEKASRGNESLAGIPTRISSLAEFHNLFGGAPKVRYSFARSDGKFTLEADRTTLYYLYNSLRLFFNNGGGPCYIVAVGLYDEVTKAGGIPAIKVDDLVGHPLDVLLKYSVPTMLVIPDAVLLSLNDWATASGLLFEHCVKMQSRMIIFDVPNGFRDRDYTEADDVISGTNGFRQSLKGNGDNLSYGAAYYPWVNSSIIEESDLDYTLFKTESLPDLQDYLNADAKSRITDSTKLKGVSDLVAGMSATTDDQLAAGRAVVSNHQALKVVSPAYQNVMKALYQVVNVMPPSGAMAGVYARTDSEHGVFRAPANVTLVSVVSPRVELTNDDQEDLNMPLDGKAINAIRAFPGRGVLVWGARTLDGNSQDWRYVSVRRTMIMLEQSIKIACETYMFAPNTAQTWVTVKAMIDNFLNNKWKDGALQGSSAADAYRVDVGLGATMTGNDILDGYMRVTVRVAVVRPAEFIVITFQQQMAKS